MTAEQSRRKNMAGIEKRVRFMRRSISILLSCTLLTWVILVDRRHGTSLTASTVALRALTMATKRPIIYTFQETKNPEDSELLEGWLIAWKSAGWDAQVLYFEDALQHSDFSIMEKALSQIMPFGRRSEKMGYYRWLAMAQRGGGWLTTLEVFPLWPLSQLDPTIFFQMDKFTVHCGTPKKPNHCLMKGSASEWQRMSVELLQSVHRHQKHIYQITSATTAYENTAAIPVWTDNFALEEVVTFANPNGRPLAQRESHVLSTPAAIQLRALPRFVPQQCLEVKDKLAVRFGKMPNLPESEAIDLAYIYTWLGQFKKDCVKGSFMSPDSIVQKQQGNNIKQQLLQQQQQGNTKQQLLQQQQQGIIEQQQQQQQQGAPDEKQQQSSSQPQLRVQEQQPKISEEVERPKLLEATYVAPIAETSPQTVAASASETFASSSNIN